jgi:hypothetical protein
MLFLNNISVKGPFINYNREFKLLEIQRFIYKHILNLDQTIDRIERAKASIRPKSQFIYNGIDIVKYIYRAKKRSPQATKIYKIFN